MRTVSTFLIVLSLSLAVTGAVSGKEKDEDAADSDNEVSIERVTLVRDAGDTFETAKNFDASDTFGVLVKLSRPKVGTKVKTVWMIVNAGGMENKKIIEKEVTLTLEGLKAAKEKDRIDFTLSHDNLYPSGEYEADIYLNGELVKKVAFRVEQ